jgi:hypothetical protein
MQTGSNVATVLAMRVRLIGATWAVDVGPFAGSYVLGLARGVPPLVLDWPRRP